jgi:hypothetical protein
MSIGGYMSSLYFDHVTLERLSDRGAGRQPVGQARSDQGIRVEQAELAAELAVVVHVNSSR